MSFGNEKWGIAGFLLILFLFILILSTQKTEAAKEPLWTYETKEGVEGVTISADGKFIATAVTEEKKLYFFARENSTPLWSYELEDAKPQSAAISGDGEYIVASSYDKDVLFFNKEDKVIFIQADESLNYGYVIRVMDIAKKAGVERVGLITEPPERKKRRP